MSFWQTKVDFLTRGRGYNFRAKNTEKNVQREEACAWATVVLPGRNVSAFVMCLLDVNDLVGAATVLGVYSAAIAGAKPWRKSNKRESRGSLQLPKKQKSKISKAKQRTTSLPGNSQTQVADKKQLPSYHHTDPRFDAIRSSWLEPKQLEPLGRHCKTLCTSSVAVAKSVAQDPLQVPGEYGILTWIYDQVREDVN